MNIDMFHHEQMVWFHRLHLPNTSQEQFEWHHAYQNFVKDNQIDPFQK